MIRSYINKPTDAPASSLESFVLDSVICMTKCMMDVAKNRITNEMNDEYPSADVIWDEARFLEKGSKFMDIVCEYDDMCEHAGICEIVSLERKVKKAAEFIRYDTGGREALEAVLNDMFSECVDRKETIPKIIKLIFN